MKVYQAMFKSFDNIKLVFDNAGLVDGTKLTLEDLKTTKGVLYWFLTVKSEEASKKQTYVTYDLLNATGSNYGDGEPMSYDVTLQINIFTNKENIQGLIENINIESELNGWKFDLATGPGYDTQIKLYIYTFNLKKVISDGT